MHAEVLEYVSRFATEEPVAVLDIGGRDVNGTSRHLFPRAEPYVVLDLRPDDNVDIVADAATWVPNRLYDIVICTEVFEHTADWPAIAVTAFHALRAGGRFVVTCAGPGRAPHSAIEATALQPGEYYENVSRDDLAERLRTVGFGFVAVERANLDTRGTAIKERPDSLQTPVGRFWGGDGRRGTTRWG
ncbi:MAG TPA: methyltransferase domain-containing protein [Rugosimonospora sp.]|nr:methyltransferase domain-containing protein [Rugosimonospora sp.]